MCGANLHGTHFNAAIRRGKIYGERGLQSETSNTAQQCDTVGLDVIAMLQGLCSENGYFQINKLVKTVIVHKIINSP